MKDESLIDIKEAANSKAKETSSKPAEPENFATGVLSTFISHSRLVIKVLVIGWAASVIFGAALYFWNDQKWRDLFSSYDFISQDGEGFNNINSGEQGNLSNDPDEE